MEFFNCCTWVLYSSSSSLSQSWRWLQLQRRGWSFSTVALGSYIPHLHRCHNHGVGSNYSEGDGVFQLLHLGLIFLIFIAV